MYGEERQVFRGCGIRKVKFVGYKTNHLEQGDY